MSETIIIKRQDLWKYSTFLLLAVLIIVGFISFTGNKSSNTGTGAGTVVNNPGQQVAVPTARAEVSADDDPVLGDKNAPVTIIEFSDYQCPFCRKFWQDTLPELKKNYIDTGKVKLVYRDFPLGFHPNAIPAAEAANCAREKDGDKAYFKMHDKIFEEQNKLDGGTVKSTIFDGWDKEVLKKWAKDIGYDIGSCLDSDKYASEIQKDESDGQAAGISGTPGFFVNGQLISGAQPYSVFKQLIDTELAK